MIDRDGRKDWFLSETDLVFAPNAVIEVDGNPADLILWPKDGVACSEAEWNVFVSAMWPETIDDLRAAYVSGRIEIEEFERRVGELLADA